MSKEALVQHILYHEKTDQSNYHKGDTFWNIDFLKHWIESYEPGVSVTESLTAEHRLWHADNYAFVSNHIHEGIE